ncbi:TPA: hypothetical protein DD449_01860 [Candidatus Berkelbacteria bacterium]|uniref:Uncharacterized protein n=1 Tax=Berkelbacteria bacterium GW2011_GWE1_39_12 TaxID=1618337 RepID=A0A0G4B3I0_9BACT|nr:MAG: hypothetical protein UT28_C0001G0714 [Berkelbacteria bacterium GW2011_GWE1_39_12]HBO60403.1 hypothetical protein [Candidatus Berkelbacteria bacterium]
MFNKKHIFEKIIYLIVLLGSFSSFLFFEENVTLKILAIILVLIGVLLTFKERPSGTSSRFELINLTILYLGFFSIYNLLYGVNLPLYIAMILVIVLIGLVFYPSLVIDEIGKSLSKEIINVYVVLTGFAIIELFLSLYFWPIDPGVKSLVLVVAYYQISSLVYFSSRSMLRLNKIGGYLLVNFLILVIVFVTVWLKTSR